MHFIWQSLGFDAKQTRIAFLLCNAPLGSKISSAAVRLLPSCKIAHTNARKLAMMTTYHVLKLISQRIFTMSTSPTFAYLGPEGTYTHEAALAFAARMGIENPELLECSSFDEVFECVDRGRCEYGVVGKENALEGPVTATLDNFALKSNATILGEEVVDIHHCLIMHPEAKIEDITRVASHAQGIAQCRRFINEQLPGRSTIITSSTADSVRKVMEDKSIAGIANAFAAKLYGAKVYTGEIEDHFGNQTVFDLIGRQGHPPVFSGDRYKSSIALFMQQDRAGTHSVASHQASAW